MSGIDVFEVVLEFFEAVVGGCKVVPCFSNYTFQNIFAPSHSR